MKKKLITVLKRLRSKRVILGIVSGVILILTSTGVIDLDLAKRITDVVTGVLNVLVELGII